MRLQNRTGLVVLVLAVAILATICYRGGVSRAFSSTKQGELCRRIVSAPPGGGEVVVPQGANWYVISPPYGVTDAWVTSNLSVSRQVKCQLIDASNSREDVLVAAGTSELLVSVSYLPWRFRSREAVVVHPGAVLGVMRQEGDRPLLIQLSKNAKGFAPSEARERKSDEE
jgi:hypothetical protein